MKAANGGIGMTDEQVERCASYMSIAIILHRILIRNLF